MLTSVRLVPGANPDADRRVAPEVSDPPGRLAMLQFGHLFCTAADLSLTLTAAATVPSFHIRSVGEMRGARAFAAAIALPSEQVLIIGGITGNYAHQSTAALYEPTMQAFTLLGPMKFVRGFHTMTLWDRSGGGSQTSHSGVARQPGAGRGRPGPRHRRQQRGIISVRTRTLGRQNPARR